MTISRIQLRHTAAAEVQIRLQRERAVGSTSEPVPLWFRMAEQMGLLQTGQELCYTRKAVTDLKGQSRQLVERAS